MKALKITSIILLTFVVILSPIISVALAIFLTPNVYENTIYGELDDKFSRLTEIEEDKVVVIGGSSVAFGLDSQLLEAHIGMPVVNFGLYAAIGTKAMLDLSLAGIDEGDIVILAPELDRQTMSMYFSAEHILPAVDEDYSMLRYFSNDDIRALLGGAFEHAGKKLKYSLSPLDPAGIYNKNNFNEYGEIKQGLRNENIMQLYYDPAKQIELSKNIVDDEFVDYLNDYISLCEERGATVYFSYCPMNKAALAEGTSSGSIKAFAKYLEKSINCEFISQINGYICDEAYFYDTNFHLNDTGVMLRTALLAQDILIAQGELRLIHTDIAPPPLPKANVEYDGEEDENCRYFTFEKMINGAYMISGLSEEGSKMDSLTVPLGYNGYKVTAIGKGAFTSGSARIVTVTEDTNLRNFFGGAFDGSSVKDLYIYYDFAAEEEKLAPCADFGGMRIHIPEGSAYTTHYDWQDSSKGRTFYTDIE